MHVSSREEEYREQNIENKTRERKTSMDNSMKVTKEQMETAIETHLMMICENHAEVSGLMDFISKSGYDVDYFIDWEKYDNAVSALAEALTEAFNDLIEWKQTYSNEELAELNI